MAICQGWGGKISGHALRIAALLHVAEHGDDSTIINKSAIENALEICSILTLHAITAFRSMTTDPDIKDAKEILRWICDNNLSSFIKADLTKKMQNRIGMSAERIDKLLNLLVQRNIVSTPIKQGKKTLLYMVNPTIGGAK